MTQFRTSSKSSRCACHSHLADESASAAQTYEGLWMGRLAGFCACRKECPALRLVYLPDEVVDEWLSLASEPVDRAHHRSGLLLAFARGCLQRLTSPVHRYLLLDGEVRADLSKQYRRDLRETWQFATDERERHKRARTFNGRVVELQTAEWLQEEGWQIVGLEACGGPTDITAISPAGRLSSIEVKFLGETDEFFESGVRSLQGEDSLFMPSPYEAQAALLQKARKAAEQLVDADGVRVLALAVDGPAWDWVSFPLENGWINWSSNTCLERVLVLKRGNDLRLSLWADIEEDTGT